MRIDPYSVAVTAAGAVVLPAIVFGPPLLAFTLATLLALCWCAWLERHP